MKKIEVDGYYVYWCEFDVAVGDTVEVSVSYPFSEIFGKTKTGTVTNINYDGSYDGPCEQVAAVQPDPINPEL